MSNSDVASIDNLMKAVYDCVTVTPGAPRQWDRERALYRDGAILIADRPGGMTKFTLEEWIASADPILARDSSNTKSGAASGTSAASPTC